MQHIIKRKGHKESFDEKKIYKSVFAACKALRMPDEESETIAQMVAHDTHEKYKLAHEIHRHDIHSTVVVLLQRYHPDVAFLYDTHKELF